MSRLALLATVTLVGTGLSFSSTTAKAQGFTRSACWAAFDPGEAGVGADPDGYVGGVFDGEYLYFFPYHNGTDRHGEVLRYRVTDPFTASSSWDTFNPRNNGVGTDPEGYLGGCFDGTFVYFSPDHNGTIHHGEVLRYDTRSDFLTATAWDTFDYGETVECANDPDCSDPDGYHGCVFDGRYIYFAPLYNGTEHHGEVLRYDTQVDFTTATAWRTFDYGATTECANDPDCIDPDGYQSVAFDGTSIYFAPWFNGTDYHGEILKFDTSGTFNDPAAWDTFDPGPAGVVGSALAGFHGAVVAEPYVYFVPHRLAGGAHGEVLRYDTLGSFSSASSWTTFDYGDTAECSGNPDCNDPDGYSDGVVANGFMYFAPLENGTDFHGEVLRYNLDASFAAPSSWNTYDPGLNGVGAVSDSYSGAVFDGRYVYFVPFGDGISDYHGEVLRLDTTCAAGIPAASTWGLTALLLLITTAATVMLGRRLAVRQYHGRR